MGVRYLKDGEDGWTPVVRRRKTKGRSESGDSSCDLYVDGRKLVEYRYFRIPGVSIHGRNSRVRQWFTVKPNPISSRTKLNSNINNYGKYYCINFSVIELCTRWP